MKRILALVFLLVPFGLLAQSDFKFYDDVTVAPSDAYKFAQQGHISPSLYTGTLCFSLPLYTYQDNDFLIPLAASYSSRGNQPNQRAALLGPGWSLDIGGCITLEVRGIPDYGRNMKNVPGFFSLFDTTLLNAPQPTQWWRFMYQYDGTEIGATCPQIVYTPNTIPSALHSNEYDAEPDLFHFNFMGHSGTFHLGYNGQIVVFNANGSRLDYRIEITTHHFAHSRDYNRIDSISITTSDGYKYIFLSDESTMDLNREKYSLWYESVAGWHLKKIVAPNGRFAEFFYHQQSQVSHTPLSTLSHSNLKDNIYRTYELEQFAYYPYEQDDPNKIVKIESKIALLDSVMINGDATIHLSYLHLPQGDQYKSSALSSSPLATYNDTYRLSGLDVVYHPTHSTLSHTTFTYSANTNGARCHYLTSINISGEGSYSMSYQGWNGSLPYPYNGTINIDHFGYYNGTTNTTYYPNTTIDNRYAQETIISSNRNPNATYALLGMISKLTYPTGGYTTFEYEPNDYSLIVTRPFNYTPLRNGSPTLEWSSGISGGVRIKKISSYLNNDILFTERSYTYTDQYGSTGIQTYTPRYSLSFSASTSAVGGTITEGATYKSSNILSYNSTHIEYRSVTEHLSDSSRILYSFTTSATSPHYMDYIALSGETMEPFATPEGTKSVWTLPLLNSIYPNPIHRAIAPVTSMQAVRGKVTDKVVYSTPTTLKPILWEHTEYDTSEYGLTTSLPCYLVRKFALYDLFIGDYPVKSETKRVYSQDSGASVCDSVSYTYNLYHEPTQIKQLLSNGDTLIREYVHLRDLPYDSLTQNSTYSALIQKNIVKTTLSEKVYLKRGNSSVLIDGKECRYSLFGSLVKPERITRYYPQGGWLNEVIINSYDTFGNITQMTTADGKVVSYIWGHKGQKLLCQAIGATYRGVDTLVVLNNYGNISSTSKSAIRSALPKAEIAFMDYEPGYGMIEYEDANGTKTEYTYTQWGKLQKEINGHLDTPIREWEYSNDRSQHSPFEQNETERNSSSSGRYNVKQSDNKRVTKTIVALTTLPTLPNGHSTLDTLRSHIIPDFPPVMEEQIDVPFSGVSFNSSYTPTTSYSFDYSGGTISFALYCSIYDSAQELKSALNGQLQSSMADTLMRVTDVTLISSQGTYRSYLVDATILRSRSIVARVISLYFGSTQLPSVEVHLSGSPTTQISSIPAIDTTTTDFLLPTLVENLAQESEVLTNRIKRTTHIGRESLTPDDSLINVTYYNSLGFPKQIIDAGVGYYNLKKVYPVIYNPKGEPLKGVLPFTSDNSNSNYEEGALQKQEAFYHLYYGSSESAPYTELITLPGTNNPIKEFKAGKIYRDSNRCIESIYAVNSLKDSIPILEVVDSNNSNSSGRSSNRENGVSATTTTLVFRGYYPVGSLTKTITVNEDGKITTVFATPQGETILEREYLYDLSLFEQIRQQYSLSNTQNGKLIPKGKFDTILYSVNTQTSDVVYVKDLYQRLRLVISPEGEKRRRAMQKEVGRTLTILSEGGNGEIEEEWAKEYCYTYGYDQRNYLNYKRIAGRGAEYYLNDLVGRVVAYQDSKMRECELWLLTAYDIGDRVVANYLTSSYTKSELETLFAQQRDYSLPNYSPTAHLPYSNQQNILLFKAAYYNKGEAILSEIVAHNPRLMFTPTEKVVVESDIEDLRVRGKLKSFDWDVVTAEDIDTLHFFGSPLYDKVLSMSSLEEYLKTCNSSRNRVVVGDTSLLKYRERAYYYDKLNRVVQEVASYPDSILLTTSSRYDYTGNQTEKVSELQLSEDKNHIDNIDTISRYIFAESFTYIGRDKQINMHSNVIRKILNSDTTHSERSNINYSYYSLGMLQSSSFVYTNPLYVYETEYDYNIQSWLKEQRGGRSFDGSGIFVQELSYYSTYKPQTVPKWSGSISENRIQQANTTPTTLTFDYDSRGYFIDAKRYSGDDITPLTIGKYTENNLSYDLNGNLLTLTRFGNAQNIPYNNFNYSYTGNKLMGLSGTISNSEHSSNPNNTTIGVTYSYDSNGNLLTDGLENVNFEYDLNNMVARVKNTLSGDTLTTYSYFADGEKVIVRDGGVSTNNSSDYQIVGRRYYGPFTINELTVGQSTVLAFESATQLGGDIVVINNPAYSEATNINSSVNPYLSLFYHKDHLGNTRVITTSAGTILEQNDYYPFGLRTTRNQSYTTLNESLTSMAQGTGNIPSAPIYLYNTKEKQEFIHNTSSLINTQSSATYTSNYLDYGARFYNPVTARWNIQDPMAEKYQRFSPYNYCVNNPINFIDIQGFFVGDYYTKYGKWMGSNGINDNKLYLYTHTIIDEKGKKLLIGREIKDHSHEEFSIMAATVYAESSAYRENSMSDELKNEMYSIAYVHIVNNPRAKAFGKSNKNSQFRKYMNTELDMFNPFQMTANAAVLNAYLGGDDPSHGATNWDGAEQALYSEEDKRTHADGFELHKNTIGWTISSEHFEKWKNNVGKSFKAPAKSKNINDKIGFKSTAVYMKTIFWIDLTLNKKEK